LTRQRGHHRYGRRGLLQSAAPVLCPRLRHQRLRCGLSGIGRKEAGVALYPGRWSGRGGEAGGQSTPERNDTGQRHL